ncbi:AI-2E family transporter [Halosimplex sp. J119]
MADSDRLWPTDRARVGWWLFIGLLGIAAAYLAYAFVGLLVAGVFGYYATRPINDRADQVIDADAVAAGITVLIVLVPIVALTLYAGFQFVTGLAGLLGDSVDPLSMAARYVGLGEIPVDEQEALRTALQNPDEFVENPQQTARTIFQRGTTVITLVAQTLLFVAMSITLSFFLLENDDTLSAALERLFGGRDTTAYAYATALDADLESVFFGNFLFVAVMFVLASAAYAVTNWLVPPEAAIPMVLVLGFLSGVASLIPVVVSKIIYVPVLGYLAYQATRVGELSLTLVAAVAVSYFLVLDFLPQTFLQPYISGRKLDGMMLMFAYLLGPILFGWYGFFLLPIVLIAMLEAVRIALPELLHGERLTNTATMAESVGADPQDEGPVPTDQAGKSGTAPGDDGSVSGESNSGPDVRDAGPDGTDRSPEDD